MRSKKNTSWHGLDVDRKLRGNQAIPQNIDMPIFNLNRKKNDYIHSNEIVVKSECYMLQKIKLMKISHSNGYNNDRGQNVYEFAPRFMRINRPVRK